MAWFKVQENAVNGKKFNVVFVNGDGAFIAQQNDRGGYDPILNSEDDYIAAPENWRELTHDTSNNEDKFLSDEKSIVIINE